MIAPLPIENTLKEIQEVSNVCLVGEGRSHPLALITLKENVLVDLKFTPGAIEGLVVADDSFRDRIRLRIQTLVEEGKLQEGVRFVVLSRDFSVEDQELTQTQKINRNRIQKIFRHFIDLQYEG
jgi:long-chain acyl-CoA synthetase